MTAVDEIFVVPRLLLESVDLPAPMKRMTEMVKDGGYLTLRRFLTSLTEEEVAELVQRGFEAQRDAEMAKDMAMFCAMLATHEGLVVLSTDKLNELLTKLMLLLQAETLVRKGLVELDYSKLTLEEVDPRNMRITNKGKNVFGTIRLKRLPFNPT